MSWGRAGRGYTKPPPGSMIDWGHPLSRGLVGCWLLNERGSKITNLAVPDSGSLTNMDISQCWVGSPGGGALQFDGSDVYIACSDLPHYSFTDGSADKPFSVSARINIGTIADNEGGAIISKSLGSGNDEEWCFRVKKTTYKLVLVLWPQGHSYQYKTFTSSGSIGLGTWTDVIACFDGTNTELWINGVLQGTTVASDTYTCMINTTSTVNIGNALRTSAYKQRFIGSIEYITLYNRTLTSIEAKALSAAPYQVILAPQYRRYFIPSAGVSIPVLMQNMRGGYNQMRGGFING